ncbi:MAG: amino acid adenylation domain-containing protein [Flavobacteriales bacterium]|nr:Linear gramicidin synthase subunit B [Flavobacteriales bacterium]MCC6576265.1 amino acid adenylation domain-containing protein [Flavobacteriales bacterium]NUQ16183.1 amino acid adenylation domain-containing protein [Flavobacteriales bacterium]
MEKFIPETRFVAAEHDPFAGPAVLLTYPTTGPQQEVWTASQLSDAASCAYNESVSLTLEGTLDVAALKEALRDLAVRHEALRTVFDSTGTRALVLEPVPLPLEQIDLEGADEQQRAETLARLDDALMRRPFDLLNGPLYRFVLLKLHGGMHRLRIVGHHAVCDGWSLGVLMADLSKLYSARAGGAMPALAPADAYSDYAQALNDFHHSPEGERVRTYWLDQYRDDIPVVDLPTDRPRAAHRSFVADRIDVPLDPVLAQDLRHLATRCGATFVTTLLSCFEVFLAHATDQHDLVVGLPAAGQSDMAMPGLTGHCVSLLPMRTRVEPQEPFSTHVKRRRGQVLDAFDHQRFTFSTLLQVMNVPRLPGRVPLVPVIFNVDMNMDDGVSFTGLRHRYSSEPRAYEQFELTLNVAGSGNDLVLEWTYNTDLFDRSTVERWCRELTALMRRLCDAPDGTIAAHLAGGRAGAAVPAEWHGTLCPMDPALTVDRMFDAVARTHAARTALVHGDRTMTYAELHQRVEALAVHLIQQGAGPGERVGLCARSAPEFFIGLLAVVRSGAAFIPLDPGLPAERLRLLLDDARPGVILADATTAPLLDAHASGTPRTVIDLAIAATLPVPQAPPEFRSAPDDPVYLIHTSGSTGTPKGVLVPHRGIVRLMTDQDYFRFGPELVFHHHLSVSFDACQLSIMGALLHGGTLVIGTSERPSITEMADALRTRGVNVLVTSSGLFRLLVDEAPEALRGLRHLMVGGDVMPAEQARAAFDLVGPGVLVNGYGPTEVSVMSTCHTIHRREELDAPVPIGRPLRNTTVHVLDRNRRPVGVGRKGELWLGGPGVALGYHGQPEMTAARFIPDPFSKEPNARLYRTGDLVRWRADGALDFLGRVDDQVKVRGQRVEPAELEAALHDLSTVADRTVVALDAPGGDKQLHLYVVPRDVAAVEDEARRAALSEEVMAHVRQRLPDALLPATVTPIARMPLTPAGKPDRKRLPPPSAATAQHTLFVAPRTPAEVLLAELWCRLLKLDRVGIHDNFFTLGGHSLLGIQLFAQVEKRTGRRLPIRTLFQAPTIAELAAAIDRDGTEPAAWKHLAAIQPHGTRTPFFCVQGDEAHVYLPKLLGADQPFYGFGHQGEDGQAIEHRSVEDIAAAYLKELRQAKPHGPYLLGGYSFGGIVAYEMARQLTTAGEEVPLLVLFDTYAPADGLQSATAEERLHMPAKRWVMRRLIDRHLRRGRTLPPALRHFHIIDTYGKATRAYVPGTYTGNVLLLRAEGSPGTPDLGWNKLVKGGVEVRPVPGDHYSAIKEPHVNALAGELRKELHAARRTQAA